ncbi:MAG: 6-bladed beta-propeller, partial [Bacteroidaceae bacterium]|nr:6-bladed beta-propeller [Bacteroidaceae bacterium]
MKRIIFLLTILCVVSCGEKTRSIKNSTSYSITVKDKFESLRSDSLFASAHYIKLETNKESLLQEISKVIIYDNH